MCTKILLSQGVWIQFLSQLEPCLTHTSSSARQTTRTFSSSPPSSFPCRSLWRIIGVHWESYWFGLVVFRGAKKRELNFPQNTEPKAPWKKKSVRKRFHIQFTSALLTLSAILLVCPLCLFPSPPSTDIAHLIACSLFIVHSVGQVSHANTV